MATAYPSPQKSVYTKRALLIGNNTYKKRNQLRFCINDAEDLAKKLSDIDFKITIDTNLTNAQMERIIKTFINEINSGDLVLFFFAGHAYQYDGLNYLLPIDDDRRKDEIDLKDRSINAQVTLQKMMRRQPSASIFLLDCCRSSFSTPGTANTSGLSAMYAAAGSLIAFACAAGEIALDESPNGRNGLFTSHLLQHVHLPNLSIDEIMYNVCAGVIKDSRGNQYPFRVNSLRRKIILNQQDQTERLSQVDNHCIETPVRIINREPITEKPLTVEQLQINQKRLPENSQQKTTNSYELSISPRSIQSSELEKRPSSWSSSIFSWFGSLLTSSSNRSPQTREHVERKWKQHGITIVGENGPGDQLNQLSHPHGIYVDDDDQCIYIADWGNDRIVEWKFDVNNGKVVAGGNGKGNRMNQLNWPTDMIVNKKNNSLIICDRGKRRVIEWSRQNGTNQGQTIISNITCEGITMDNNGDIYVSDYEKDEVRRWKRGGETQGIIVAGGNRWGNQLNQLHFPTYLFVDEDQSVYVTDSNNHRVMKWMKGAKKGVIVAGGQGEGNSLSQLSDPQGVMVDQWENVYVADNGNDRIMCWSKGSKQGRVIVGGNRKGKESNQLNYPSGISFDRQGHLYVVDQNNNRVQKFEVDNE